MTSSYNRLTEAIRKSVAARQLKQFYDSNMQATQDDIQKRRATLYKGLVDVYGQGYANELMKSVNEYVSTGKGLDKEVVYKGKKTTVRNLTNNIHGALFSLGGGAEIKQMRELQVNGDKAVNDFADMNGISKKTRNEIIFGIKDPENDSKGNSDVKYTKALKDARNEAIKKRKKLERAKKQGTQGEFLKAQEEYKAANEAYSKLSGSTLENEDKSSAKSAKSAESAAKKAQKARETAAKAAEKAAEQQNEANEKAFEIETKAKLENRRKAEDLANETEQAEINILKDGNEKKLRQIELARKSKRLSTEHLRTSSSNVSSKLSKSGRQTRIIRAKTSTIHPSTPTLHLTTAIQMQSTRTMMQKQRQHGISMMRKLLKSKMQR